MLTHSLIQYLTLPATPPSPVALAAGVRFIHKARLYEREIKDSLSPITRIVTVCAQRQDAQYCTEQVAQLVESIKQFGWTNPVLIDEKGEIIAGHGRVMAAEMLKMDSVPVIVLSGLTDEQKKAYRLADNRLPMNAGWDEDLLRMELSDLINADFDVSLTGFIPTEIDELLTDVLPGTGNEEEPYTTKIDTPVYEPSGGKPDISELYDDTKTQELISRIRSASLEPDIEKFLLCAAERHTVFNFSRIADYYAHAPSEIQCFFEESALVIIDYQQAIENGFVRMTQRMVEIMHGGEEEEYA